MYSNHYRYGHTCLMMELAGAEGILVSGGALTGKHVDFYDLNTKRYVTVIFTCICFIFIKSNHALYLNSTSNLLLF